MRNVRQNDAVTPIIGAILLLAILSTFLVILQVVGLPVWNSDVEFDHSRDVRGDMQRLDAAVSEVASTNSHRSVVVDLGARYPNRVVLINPSPASGTLSTEDGFVNVSNMASVEEGVRGYWNGSNRSFTTRRIEYEPNYNYYHDAPSRVYDNGVLYNSGGDQEVVLGEQSLVNGDNINIVVLNGSVSTSSVQPTTVSLVPVSVSRTSVAVTNSTDGEVSLTLDSRLSADDWEELLKDERYVVDVSEVGDGTVEITLQQGVTYDLRMAEVGLGTGEKTNTRYTLDVSGNGTTVPTQGSAKLVVEARDRYNNPVGGEEIEGSVVSGGGSLTEATKTTGTGGTATFEYNAPDTATTAKIRTNVSGTNSSLLRNEFRVYVMESSSDGVSDSTPPVVEGTDVESYRLEPCSEVSGIFCDHEETYQVRFAYNVTDDVGLDKARLILRHTPDSSSGGSIDNVTAATHTLDGSRESRGWETPWIKSGTLDANRIDKYVVEMEVYDEAGNNDSVLVDVPPPG